ncbi:hypothetical protein [Companilactobacillus sp.]|jgi:hypothetical protein|uniref:hypothetical protein n=1 Tax=Companilactobacillus sp. TaxID=2767905 RepID=UPI0025BD2C34|nr:hypothetical protein [Companilactobacillus sp.]MCH4009953.1 hypothetical protein [Companilactobacillus sp.]MCH4052371.1 hypothetical protein [Companilactobacillus sp.]MCH4077895.1 hypothetical protein [Companilactobacillus sp.]MCH4126471.1 hypothetical protein [Companilactobacillus sp.]MCH4132057.1 hypothetical protein [Companilactobacillus sp.]
MDEKKLIEKKIFNDTSRYNDIMERPYQQSKRHLPMNQLDRAFQFAPFGALEGFNGLIQEKTKMYARKKYSNAEQEQQIMRQLKYLQTHPLQVDVSYFNEDSGYYDHVKGLYKSIDLKKGRVTFEETSTVIVNIREIKLLNKK